MTYVWQTKKLKAQNTPSLGMWMTTSCHTKSRSDLKHHRRNKEKFGDLYLVKGNKQTFLGLNIGIKIYI